MFWILFQKAGSRLYLRHVCVCGLGGGGVLENSCRKLGKYIDRQSVSDNQTVMFPAFWLEQRVCWTNVLYRHLMVASQSDW